MTNKSNRGRRHIDRLADSIFAVMENPDINPELQLDAAKVLFAVLERRRFGNKKKSAETRAIEKMMGGRLPSLKPRATADAVNLVTMPVKEPPHEDEARAA